MRAEQNNKKIKIAVDALAISKDSAGSFVVLVGLIKELIKLSDIDFVLYVTKPDIERTIGGRERLEYVYAPKWAKIFFGRLLWQQFILPILVKKAGCSLLYSASGYPEIFTKLPVVTHQQNLWSFEPPQQWWSVKNIIKSFLRRQVAKIAILTSDANIFISEYLRDIANLSIPKSAQKNFTVVNAISSKHFNFDNIPKGEYSAKEYCLAVGSLVVHKNYLALIHAFRFVANECPALEMIIVGNFTNKYGNKVRKLCKKLKLDKKVIFTGGIDFEKVISLYHQAKFSVNVSLLEGFGLPVLESMASACPVVCSDIPVFHEIGGESVLYCNPTNAEDIAKKMIYLYKDEKKRKILSMAGLERSKSFSWCQSAVKMIDVFKFAMGG
ncbi:MAG: glycosyltransferase family 1 protein [Phycisphaerae bacterium]